MLRMKLMWMQREAYKSQQHIEGLQESKRQVEEDKANSQRLHHAAEVRGRDLEDQVTACLDLVLSGLSCLVTTDFVGDKVLADSASWHVLQHVDAYKFLKCKILPEP